ncbi:MAG: MASE1 domain-containing protein [Gemmatimonadales bacterium]
MPEASGRVPTRPLAHALAAGALVCIGYYLGARVGFALTLHPVPVSTLWPPNAILLSALLLAPSRWWWALILAALPAHLLAELGSGIPLPMVLCWFVSNSAEALVGAVGVRLLVTGPLLLDSFRQVLVFLLFPVFLAPFLSSFLDAWFVQLNRFGQIGYWQVWQTRFTANIVAALTLIPLIVIVGSRGWDLVRNLSRRRWLELTLVTVALLVVCTLVFVREPAGLRGNPALLYAPLPMLLWSAVRFGPAGASASFLVLALFAIGGATRGLGPFVTSSPQANAYSMQQFLIISAVPLMTLAAVLRDRAHAEARALRDEARLRLALIAAQMGTWEWEVSARQGSCSDTTRDIFGLPRGTSLTIRRLLSLVLPDDRPTLAQAMRRSSEPGGLYEAEFRVARPDRSIRWVRANAIALSNGDGTPKRLLGVTADITEEKQVLDAVQESEARFRSVFEMGILPMAFWHTDGRISDANDAYLRLTGFSRSELQEGQLRWDRLTAPEFRYRDEEALRELRLHGWCAPYEKEYLLRDGRRIPIQTGAAVLGADYGICVEMDLSARKRVERELESRLRFERLVSDLSATFATERDSRAEDQIPPWLGRLGEFLDVPWVSVSQLSRGQRVLRLMSSWTAQGFAPLPETVWEREFAAIETTLVAGRTVTIEDCEHAAGTPELDRRNVARLGIGALLAIPLVASGNVFGALTFVGAGPRKWPAELVRRLRLIGEIFSSALARKALEGDRRQAEAVNAAILASLPGMTAILDQAGRIVRVNEAWSRFGHAHPTLFDAEGTEGDLVKTCQQAAAAGNPLAQEVSTGLQAVLSGSRHDFSLTFPLFNGDNGEANWQEMLVLRLARREGGAVVTRLDCTARKRAELEAERNRAELAHVVRVATMGELTASLAHELSQPLTAIRSNAQAGSRMMGSATTDTGEIRAIFADIVANDRRASEILGRIRNLVRKADLELVPLELNGLAREVASLVQTDTVLRGAITTLELADGPLPVRGDRIQLQQVVLNLILNGLEAMAGTDRRSRRLSIQTVWYDTEQIQLAVRDTGTGIAGDRIDHIFDPFYTSKPDGLGMGLSIARTIVQAHGGRVWAENNHGQGASVGFVLPA